MEDFLPRIQKIALAEGITIGALERQIGASKGVLSRAISNGTDIQSKWIRKIIEKYPQYSTRWLMTGEGSMLKSSAPANTPATDNPVSNSAGTSAETTNKILAELTALRELFSEALARRDAQIDRLLAIIADITKH